MRAEVTQFSLFFPLSYDVHVTTSNNALQSFGWKILQFNAYMSYSLLIKMRSCLTDILGHLSKSISLRKVCIITVKSECCYQSEHHTSLNLLVWRCLASLFYLGTCLPSIFNTPCFFLIINLFLTRRGNSMTWHTLEFLFIYKQLYRGISNLAIFNKKCISHNSKYNCNSSHPFCFPLPS